MSALSPTLPTLRMFFMLAMPCTTVQKMMGAISILMSLMKASPKGFIASPQPGGKSRKGCCQAGTFAGSDGERMPSTTPMKIAARTFT